MSDTLSLIAAVIHFFLAYWVWRVKKIHTGLHYYFIFFSLITAIWLIATFIEYRYYDLFAIRLTYALSSLMAATALIWILYFVKINISKAQSFFILIPGIVFFCISLLTNGIIVSVHSIGDGNFSIAYGGWFYILMIYAAIYVGIMVWSLVRAFIKSIGIYHEQLRYILIGTFIFGIETVISTTFFPYIGHIGDSPIHYIDALSAMVFTLLAAYAVVRYRFLDVRIVIRKGTVYALTVVIALGIYTYLVFVGSETAKSIFDLNDNFSGFIAVALIAVGFNPLRQIVEHALDTYLFHKRIDLRAVGKRLSSQLATSITEIEKTLSAIRSEAGPALGVNEIDLFIQKEAGKWEAIQPSSNANLSVNLDSPFFKYISKIPDILITDEIDFRLSEQINEEDQKNLTNIRESLLASHTAVIVPIFNPHDLIGILFLGPKPNQSAYTIEDIQFLKTLQQNLMQTLSGVILYYQAMKRTQIQMG